MSTPISATSAAAAAQAASASCCQVIVDYINKILASVPGMKSLLLDVETVSIVGLVYPLSDIIQKEVYYVDRLYQQAPIAPYGEDERKEKDVSMQHLKAVAYVRPTQASIEQLRTVLRSNRYKEYYIFFSNAASDEILRSLASADSHELIRQVQEFYGDLYAISRTCFHFDQYKTRSLCQPPSFWHGEEKTLFERNLQGLLSTFLAFKKRPEIRYTASSELTKIMAHEMTRRMKEEADLFTFQGEPPLLLLLDRRDDPVTPILMQWTYQAMVHEILGIHHNRVDMRHVTGNNAKAELQEVVLSPEQDHFFRGSQFLNFGDLGQSIKDLVQDYQRKSHTNTKMESIEDMQKFVETYPEFRAMAGNVSKHVTLVSELSKQIETRKLLNVSELEQELACNQDHATALENLLRMLEDPRIIFYDKLRLVLLYSLRYENNKTQLPQLKKLLRDKTTNDQESRQIAAIDALLQHAGAAARGGDLFGNKTVFNMAKRFVTGLKGVENIYTQHKPLMSETLTYLLQQRLKTSNYPYVDATQSAVADKKRYRLIYIYMMGGCTMAELALVEALNQSEAANGVRLILGGSCIHNSRTFISDAAGLDPEVLSSTIGGSRTSHHGNREMHHIR